MKLFTYGTLKYPENLKRDGATNIIENTFVRGYKMYVHGTFSLFPITKNTGNPRDVIYGTLSDVPDNVITTTYDSIEGYSPNRSRKENMYNRLKTIVHTPDGEQIEAYMYVTNERYFKDTYKPQNLVPSGNFDDARWRKERVPSFNLGNITITRNALSILDRESVRDALIRFAEGEWGDVDEDEWEMNDLSAKLGGRLLGSYEDVNGTKFWIITEADRSATTVLLPEDY